MLREWLNACIPSHCTPSQSRPNLYQGVCCLPLQNVSVSCILSAHSRGLPISVSLILLQIFIPFAVLSALSIAWLAAFFWHGFRSGNFSAAWLSKRLELTAYSVLGYYYPSLTQASLSVFSCLTIDHPIPSNTPYAYAAQVTCSYDLLMHAVAGLPLFPC